MLALRIVSQAGDARSLYYAALDREAEFDDAGALALLLKSVARDPSFLPAHVHITQIYTRRGWPLELKRLYPANSNNPVLDCMSAYVNAPTGYRVAALPRIEEIERRTGPNACTAFMKAVLIPALTPANARLAQSAESAAQAWRLNQDLPEIVAGYSNMLRDLGRGHDATSLLQNTLASPRHPMQRVMLLAALREDARVRGDSLGERAAKRALDALAARDRRPGVVQLALNPWVEPDSIRRTRLRKQVERARNAGAWTQEFEALLAVGNAELDAGSNGDALRDLGRAATIAQREKAPGLQMTIHRLLGRAYAKTGNLTSALSELHTASALYPRVQDDYELAEVYHNLAHAYEGAGRLDAAAAAAQKFVELTRPFIHSQPRMMSLHDAAQIRWNAGWHASATAALDEMVRVIDQQQTNHYWAGEYYERLGDYERANRYYTAGLASATEASLNYAGLVRVYSALGKVDSADAAAAAHDRLLRGQFDVPLRPQTLLRIGRVDEALRISKAWADEKLAEQHVQGAALALNALAQLYLDAHRPAEALAAAGRAEALAARLNLVVERATALRTAGTAQLHAGKTRPALLTLERAVTAAQQTSSLDARRLAHIALADAYAAAGDTTGALSEYKIAALQIDTISITLTEDLTRAEFRSNQRLAFDRAMTLLLSRARPDVSTLVEWSERRKGAALSFVRGRGHVRPLEQIQTEIQPAEVVVDYIVLDSVVAATVLTRHTARLVRLDVRPPEVQALAARIRSPMLRVHAGRLDLARANFDSAASARLYEVLLASITELAQARQLTIVPDGAVHGVAFDALVTARDQYLIDRFAVRQIPSLALMGGTIRIERTSKVLLVLRETPGGFREMQSVRTSFPNVRMLTNEHATEASVQQLRPAYDVVHFATHARADERDPMGSHLTLAPSGKSDGFLHVSEIAEQRAQNALVVLSACETQGGPVFAGEGVMGISRAFLASGARSVIATTWPVGPATADLMGVFYREVARGASVTDALRTAKLALRRDPATAHPFFWASFVLVTRGR